MDTCTRVDTSPSRSGTVLTWSSLSHRIIAIILGYMISKTSSQACGGTYTANTAEILSPDYPNAYPHGSHCVYRIIRPSPGPMTISFLQFDLESHDNCKYDYLRIFDGPSTDFAPLATYCGTHPAPVHTTSNQATLVFHSDSSVSHEGFRIYYSGSQNCETLGGRCTFDPCVSPTYDACDHGATCCMASSNEQCSRQISRSYGILESPNYPASYDNQLDCIYTITRPGSVVALKFEVFELEEHNSCDYDYVEIHDGENVRWPTIARFCGTNAHDIISKGEHITIHFHSDSSITKQGFRLVWGGSNCAFWGGVCTSNRCDFTSDYSCPDGQYCCHEECDLYSNKICPDGSCVGNHLSCDPGAEPLPGGVSCPTYARICPDGTCISGEYDCPCAAHQVQCWDGSCVLAQINCPCGPASPYNCANGYGCFNHSQNCNKVEDCQDGSDELSCGEDSGSLTWVYGLVAVSCVVIFFCVLTLCSKRQKERMRTGSTRTGSSPGTSHPTSHHYRTATLAGLGAPPNVVVTPAPARETHAYDNLALDAPPPYTMHTFFDIAPPSYEASVSVLPSAPSVPLPLTAESPPSYESLDHVNGGVFMVGGAPHHKPEDDPSMESVPHNPQFQPASAVDLPRVDASPVRAPSQNPVSVPRTHEHSIPTRRPPEEQYI